MPALFLGTFLFGETIILAASFLAAQGLWSAWTVWWLALLGTLGADALWFLYGQKILAYFHRWETYRRSSEKFLGTLEKITGAHPHRALLFVKAVYGTRILTIIYLSIRRVNFLTFITFDAIGTAWWLAIIVLFGWLTSRGVVNLIPTLDRLEYLALAIIVIIIVWRLAFLWLGKKITKE